MNLSRFGQSGLRGLYRMISDQRTWPIGAASIGVPGWPELAFCTASTERTLTVLIHNCSRSFGWAPTASGWGIDVVLAMSLLPKKPCHLTNGGGRTENTMGRKKRDGTKNNVPERQNA